MPASPGDPLLGCLLDGRYRVLTRIADGGMATVYVGVDERLEREVALKVMRPALAADAVFVGRFQREARSAAQLSHPNVVAVFDQGEDDGRVFLAMELVSGKTLREVIHDEGPLTPRAALDLIDPVLRALDAAHRGGLVHRDVKPENVILRQDGQVKVADFGLARAISTDTATAQTGVLLGTVAYLAPEQVERGVADARSDVYAAGLLLFEMLTGRKAFTGDTAIHVAYQHVHGQVPAPSSVVRTVPEELDRLVAVATARDPDERPSDAGELLLQVRRSRASLSAAELDARPTGVSAAAPPAATVAVPQTEVVTAVGSRGVRTTSVAASSAASSRATSPGGGLGATRVVELDEPQTMRLPPAGEPPAGPPRPVQRRGSARMIAALVVLLLVVLAALWAFLAGPLATGVVPVVAGQTQASAIQRLSAAHLTARVQQAFSETVTSGHVVSSSPPAGSSARRSVPVTLLVSKGPERFRVPSLVGRNQAEASNLLGAGGLSVGEVRQSFSDTAPAGQVVATDPKAGSSVKRGTPVSIVVSKGPQPIVVQDWSGRPYKEAVTALTDAGLKVDASQQQFSDTVAKGFVVSQRPAGGASLKKGDTVSLVVSKGPVLVAVPDVTSKQLTAARRILEKAGFTVAVNNVLGGIFGTVRLQDPVAGSMVPAGSTITLTVV